MILWTWHDQNRQWKPQPLQPSDDIALGKEARLWAIQNDTILLFARPSVFVNGRPALPLQPLADRDEIHIGAAVWCVSVDSLPTHERFHASEQVIQCARCQGVLADGDATIICPQCQARYHDTTRLPCWTYGPTCARCRRSTARSIWQPEPLSRSTRTLKHDHAPIAR